MPLVTDGADHALLLITERDRWRARASRLADDPSLQRRATEQATYYEGFLRDVAGRMAPRSTLAHLFRRLRTNKGP